MAGKVVGERKCKRRTKREVQEWIDREYGHSHSEIATLPLKQFIDIYETEILYGLRSPQTVANYQGHWKLRILPALGTIRIGDLTAVDIERAQAGWERAGVSYTVQYGARQALSRVLTHAIVLNAIQSNPVLDARKPSRGVERDVFTLGSAEVPQVLDRLRAVDPIYADLAHVAVLTGLRTGELLALQHGDIDAESGRVHVRRAWSGTGKDRTLQPPKNGKSRSAPWPAELQGVVERRWKSDQRTGLFFTGPRGGTLWLANIQARTGYKQIMVDLGHPEMVWHDLRATAIVSWIKAGVPLTTVRDWAGHSSLRVTDRYARAARNDHADALKTLNSYLTRTSASQTEGRETA